MAVTLVADDLTGACDTGALFAGQGRVPVVVWGTAIESPGEDGAPGPALALDTESRSLEAGAAAERCRTMAGRHVGGAGHRYFKKIDSTMRGPVGGEIDALIEAGALAGAVVCPSFPAQGRTVVGGELRVDGVPAHRSPIGRDPGYPGATSDLAAILSGQSPRPVRHLSLGTLRARGGGLARALDAAEGHLLVSDGETDEDLAALARAVLGRPSLLLAGSAGLGRAVAAALHALPAGPGPLPADRAWLVVAGSQHPATRAQVGALTRAGVAAAEADDAPALAGAAVALAAGRPAVLTAPPAPAGDRALLAARLADGVARLLEAARPALLVLTGGETAHAVLRRIGARRLDLVGVPGDGLALAEARLWAGPPLPVLTKAGGFGAPDLLVHLLRGASS